MRDEFDMSLDFDMKIDLRVFVTESQAATARFEKDRLPAAAFPAQ